MSFLMLGEAPADLICEQAAEGIGEAGAFTPHFGGAPSHEVPGRAARAISTIEAGARATESWGAVA